jgi:hypothetical protein
MAARILNGVVCLISALAVHELVTQAPHAVDIAIARGAEKPRIDHPPVNVCWFSGNVFRSGIETRLVDCARIRVYAPRRGGFLLRPSVKFILSKWIFFELCLATGLLLS